jgi:hypothetical protein
MALQMVLGLLAGWLDRREREAIVYLNRREPPPAASAWWTSPAFHRQRSPPAGRSSIPSRACSPEADRHHRDARHAAAMASPVDRSQVDVRQEIPTARCSGPDPSARHPHGDGESDVGLHANPRRAQECRPLRGRSTVRRILKAGGLPPVPQRPTSWQTFLKAHWGGIAGADFFTTEVWTWRGLVTYYTVFVIDLASRRVQILGSTQNPEALFMQQMVRTLTMAKDGAVRTPQDPNLRSRSEVER